MEITQSGKSAVKREKLQDGEYATKMVCTIDHGEIQTSFGPKKQFSLVFVTPNGDILVTKPMTKTWGELAAWTKFFATWTKKPMPAGMDEDMTNEWIKSQTDRLAVMVDPDKMLGYGGVATVESVPGVDKNGKAVVYTNMTSVKKFGKAVGDTYPAEIHIYDSLKTKGNGCKITFATGHSEKIRETPAQKDAVDEAAMRSHAKAQVAKVKADAFADVPVIPQIQPKAKVETVSADDLDQLPF